MSAKTNLAWLLLLLRLPATHSAELVAIWRKLKKSGAIQIQTSTYILPDNPPRYETFQWLTQHIRDAGGDATPVRAPESERSRDGFAETGRNSAQIKIATEARVTKFSRQSLAHSPAAGDRPRRLG